jgi:hypothetical protein
MILKFYDNVKAYIDLNFLKESYENGLLKGSYIFARLFCIDDKTPFKKEENINKNLFQDFHINFLEWSYFLTFLKFGKILKNNIYKIEKINNLVNKFGPVPEFEKYYNNILNNKVEEDKIKNIPIVKPEDDIDEIYNWKIAVDNNLQYMQNRFSEYDTVYTFRRENSLTDIFYLRKIKN